MQSLLTGAVTDRLFAASLLTVAVAGGLFAASFWSEARRRRIALLTLLGGLLAGMLAWRLHLSVPMGDYHNYVQSRKDFRDYMGLNQVEFQSHLGSKIVALLYLALGGTNADMGRAFALYAGLASLALVAALLVVAALDHWSPRSLRYAAIAVAAPPTLLFFGYRELAYEPLALAALAFPLIVTGLREDGWRLKTGGVLLGLAAALHGYQLFGLLAGILIVLLGERDRRAAVTRALDVAIYGIAAYLVWLPLYLIVSKLDIVPGHTAAIPHRPLFHRILRDHRWDWPIFSWKGGREVLIMLGAGGPLLYVPAALASVPTWLKRTVLLGAVPVLLFYVDFWPVQGIGNDTDLAFGTFPVLYALAWLAATRVRTAALGVGLLVIAQPLFWLAVTAQFVVPQIG